MWPNGTDECDVRDPDEDGIRNLGLLVTNGLKPCDVTELNEISESCKGA